MAVGWRVSVGRRVWVGGGVRVMVGEGVGLRVGGGVGEGSVGDGPVVGLGMGVRVAVGVAVGVGGSPVMVKRPDIFQLAPAKI